MMSAEDSDSDAKSEFTITSASSSSAPTTDSGASTESSESDADVDAVLHAGSDGHGDSSTGMWGVAQAENAGDLVRRFDDAAVGAPLRLVELESAFGVGGDGREDEVASACRGRQKLVQGALLSHSMPLVHENGPDRDEPYSSVATPTHASPSAHTSRRDSGWLGKLWEPPRQPTFLPRTQLPPFSPWHACSAASAALNTRSAGHTTRKGSSAHCRTTSGTEDILSTPSPSDRRLEAFRKARAERETTLFQLEQ